MFLTVVHVIHLKIQSATCVERQGRKTECLRAPLVAPFHRVVDVSVLVQEVATINTQKHNLLCF